MAKNMGLGKGLNALFSESSVLNEINNGDEEKVNNIKLLILSLILHRLGRILERRLLKN